MFDLPQNKINKKQDWIDEIENIKQSLKNKPEICDKKQAVNLVKKSILTAFNQRIPQEKFGILFSGGVDSTVLAFLSQKTGLNFNCYLSVIDYKNFSDPHDLTRAKSAAKELGLNLKIRKTNLKELEKILPQVIKNIQRHDPVHVGIAAALWPGIDEIKKDNLKYFMTGLGTEQIYAGGEKYRKISVNKINKLSWEQLGEIIWDGDISRDVALEKHFGLKMFTLFLSKETISAAMQISGKLKYNPPQKTNHKIDLGSYQKYIFRLVAENLGLPKELAWRRNRPTQYGSKFDKGIEKLAKINGFKYKKEYLKKLAK